MGLTVASCAPAARVSMSGTGSARGLACEMAAKAAARNVYCMFAR